MNKHGYLQTGVNSRLTWRSDRMETGSICIRVESNKLVLNYRCQLYRGKWEDIEQTIFFDRTPCNFGGHRKWFLCHHCSRRVVALYCAGRYFLCRHCCDLTYGSQQEEPHYRLLRKSIKIREKLGDNYCYTEFIPPKPKGMHWKTYYRLRDELAMTEKFADSIAMIRHRVPIGEQGADGR